MSTPTPSKNSSPTSTPILNSLLKTNWKKRFNSSRTPSRFASPNPTPLSSAPPDKPLFVSTSKNVVLLDWWLIKVKTEDSSGGSPEAFNFGVGGNAFNGRASTYFCSGEIVKRFDEMTLETVEGIRITLSGLLNRFRTLENGFPSQVCDDFFLGFPFDWKEFGAQYFGGQSIHGARSSKVTRMSPDDIDDPRCLLSSFDNIPVTRLFDHMMVSSGDYNECPLTRSVFDDILSEYGSSSAKLNEEDTDQIIAEDSLPNETRSPLHVSEESYKPPVARSSAPEVSGNQSRVPQIDKESRTLHKSGSKKLRSNLNTCSHILIRSQASGILTRSKARSKKLRTEPEDITAEPDVTAEEDVVHLVQITKISDSCPTSEASDSCPTSEAEKSEKDASSRNVATKFSEVNNRGILTRSKARSKKLRTDPEDITAEPDVTAEEDVVHLVQITKISDSCPTSEAEKSEKDASSRNVATKFSEVNNRHLDGPEVRRSGRPRKVVHYRC